MTYAPPPADEIEVNVHDTTDEEIAESEAEQATDEEAE